MRIRPIYASNIVLAVALLGTLAFFAGRESAVAQNNTASRQLRVGFVDFTRLSTEVRDVKKIEELMKQLAELRRIKEDFYKAEIETAQDNIEALRDHGQEDTQEWDDYNEKLRDLVAKFESVKSVTEFRMKKLTMVYSARLLKKILRNVELHAQGRFDVVHKVLGDPSDEEVERLGSALGDAVNFNLGRAREVLYYAKNSSHVEDITDAVANRVNLTQDDDVTKALGEELAKIQAEIEQFRNQGAAPGGSATGDNR